MGTVDEVAQLYRTLSPQLERIVRFSLRAPPPVIEDACQAAWSRLVDHRRQVSSEAALVWLVKTALREGSRLSRRDLREESLEQVVDRRAVRPELQPTPEEVALQWERLQLDQLSPRQQRLIWLQALGFKYTEIALHEGSSKRAVERQLRRAKKKIRSG